MVLLEKLWDDIVVGPQPKRGLGRLRKVSPKSLNVKEGEGKLSKLAMSMSPRTPETPDTPVSAHAKDNVWKSVFHRGSNLASKFIEAMFITRNQAIGLLLIFLGISGLCNDCVSRARCLNEKVENLGKPRVFNSKPHHKWVGPSSHRLIMVDVNGFGDFQSVQSTVNAVPVNNTINVVILIKPGCYIEKMGVPMMKSYITFQRARKYATVIEWHDRASDPGPTASSSELTRTSSTTSLPG
ncbi:hypothetical protein EV1_014017 [Malus domestica]